MVRLWITMQILCFIIFMFGVKSQKLCQSPLSAVENFREYLRIDTSKEENLDVAVDFWIRQAVEAGLPYSVYSPAGKPIFVATWEGTEPYLPSIMLNSHMDVVTADGEWIYPPFDAHIDENGDIYARGSQDAKDNSIQYMEAIKQLKNDGVRLARTLHVTVMPDEETGGADGMKAFIKTEEFKSLNVGFAFDEGIPSMDNDTIYVVYQDKRPWQFLLEIGGTAGHGSLFLGTSAMENTFNFMKAAMAYRETQKAIALNTTLLDNSGYTTVNINSIQGGEIINVIPTEITLGIDMRLAMAADNVQMQELMDSWIREAGNNTKVTYLRQEMEAKPTVANDSNPFWVTMKSSAAKMGLNLVPITLPATTDINELRNLGIPAFGFSTKLVTQLRVHERNEYHNMDVFLKGIEIFKEIIRDLANMK